MFVADNSLRAMQCNAKEAMLLMSMFIADDSLQAMPRLQNLLGRHSSHIQVLRQGAAYTFSLIYP